MASEAMDEYFVYENRLASFTKPQAVAAKRRASNTSTHSRAPKALSWPHKSIKPADMAKAGFVFQPLPSNPDNVACFLCNKALDGWEQDDNPLEEHLRHSPECGWAITAAVEVELGAYAAEDPRDALMVEARRATFADMWPHESKKGWTCKTKQLVEAGWKYTPLAEGDDNATCAYCQLALDGWEKNDKPWDEHYSRAPNCPFFSLISSKPAPKKAGRSKAARTSKASRLSLQSVATLASDMPSLADATADVDDSVVTTASKASKTTKGKKATASRARKTRAKKDEAVEVHEVELEQDAETAPLPPPNAAKGRKRTSDEVEESATTNAEAPAPKKRATKSRKARGSNTTEVSQADNEMTDDAEPARKPAAKKTTKKAPAARKASSSRGTRKASVATTTSAASPPPQIPDDDEIDRQLEADLDRPLGEDDENMLLDADPETKRAAASREKRASETQDTTREELLAHTATTDFAMFDPKPAQPTDEQIEADLQSMKDEMDVDQREPEPEPVPVPVPVPEHEHAHEPEHEPEPEPDETKVPKKGRKAGTRKVSKPTTMKKAKEVAPSTEQPPSRMAVGAEEPDEIAEAEVSFASNGTVARNMSLGRASLSRVSLGSITSTLGAKPPAKRGRPPKKRVSQDSVEPSAELAAPVEAAVDPAPEAMEVDKETTLVPVPVPVEATKKRPSTGKRGRPPKKSQAPDVSSEELTTVEAPAEAPAETPAETSAEIPAEPEPEAVQDEVETAGASSQENLSAASSSPRVPRKPVPAPKDSPFAMQPKAAPAAPAAPDSEPRLLGPPKTPGQQVSPAQSAKQATVSPSPSPQPSDEENRPPSSKPGTTSSKASRQPLGELPVATPTRQMSVSPSKQPQTNVVSGLQSTEQWSAVDLDLIFEEFYHDQENAGRGGPVERFFAKGGELTDDERNMTVEEWIYHNAGRAEEKLKFECESMVMRFESEGTRAMRVLEGLVVE